MQLSKQLGWIGVDVGTHAVKLAQAVRTSAGVRLHRAAVIQRTIDWSGDDALARDQPASSQAEIYAALEGGHFSGRHAICAPPMNACQLRGLNVPPGTDEERRTMIADELVEEWAERGPMEFDFWELESVKAEKPTDTFNVNVLATSRPWVWQLARDCRQSGLDCWAIDGMPLAISRAVGLVGGASGGRRVLAIDWGYSNTTLCVVNDDRPLYVRRIHHCGFGRVLDAMMQALGVTLDEAQHLADTQGLVTPDLSGHTPCAVAEADLAPVAPDTCSVSEDPETQAAITAAAEETIMALVSEVLRTLHFMETQRRHMHPMAIWLLGGGASLRNISAQLAPLVPLPVHIWRMRAASEPIACASGGRAALFGGAVALSALAWGAA